MASALLAAAEEPNRAFDAVVVGEYERAFHGDQFRQVVARLAAVGVQVWLPEAGGPVELDSPVHQALMVLLGAQAQREVVRARHRVLAAMRFQARVQGRFLGGRPPYGYRLADAGPHPNPVHARWGRRLHVLEPDPMTARWVEWMFAQRARGRSVASLVRELNARGVPCPSSVDPGRNGHRVGDRWIVRTVAMILENPRYTGRQVWNRQSTKGHGAGGRRCGRGSGAVRRNPSGEWEVSEALTHPPLVDDATFLAVQGMRAGRKTKDGETRRYVLAGLVVCAICGRRMDAHWVHGRPAYRCRHGYTSATPRPADAPRNVYLREDHLLKALSGMLAGVDGTQSGPVVGGNSRIRWKASVGNGCRSSARTKANNSDGKHQGRQLLRHAHRAKRRWHWTGTRTAPRRTEGRHPHLLSGTNRLRLPQNRTRFRSTFPRTDKIRGVRECPRPELPHNPMPIVLSTSLELP